MGRTHESLSAVVEAGFRRRRRQTLDERARDPGEAADACGQQIGRIRVIAAEELVPSLA
jgi:hypothetical protein